MTSTERYRKDPAYRERCIARSTRKHAENMQSATYRKLRKVRVDICNWRTSIEVFQAKIKALRQRIESAIRKKEELELAFGQERARRKRQ